MKKTVLITISVLLISGLIFAQSIQVQAPKPGQIWHPGDTVKITWTQSGCDSPYMKINIFRDSISQANFVTQLHPHNSGWTNWHIPDNFPVGLYILRIKSDPAINGCTGDSELFEIMKKVTLTPTFKPVKIYKKPVLDAASVLLKILITQPVEGGKYEGGKPMTIQWNNNFTSNAQTQVKLSLHNAQNMKKLEDISLYTSNDGSFPWTPSTSKYSWPGRKYVIAISTTDHKFNGQSGHFSIFAPATELPPPPAPKKKKVIAITAVVDNGKTENHTNSGEPDCLSMGMSQPGRWAKSKELKTGHWKRTSEGVKCGWAMHEYYFFSNLDFDLAAVKGKEVVRAEMLISLGEFHQHYPHGDYAGTNAYCSGKSRIIRGDSFVKSFSIYEEGKNTKVDLLNDVRKWSESNAGDPFRITIRGDFDYVPIKNSECLKYYPAPILFVEYKE